MYCSVSITRPEHYIQAVLCEVLFQFESQTVSSHKKNNMASKFTVGTPNILGKVWNIDVERGYRKLSYLFQNPEWNNRIITERWRQLKLFTHQQSSTIMFHSSIKRTAISVTSFKTTTQAAQVSSFTDIMKQAKQNSEKQNKARMLSCVRRSWDMMPMRCTFGR